MNSVDLSALRMSQAPQAIPKRPLGPRLLAVGAGALVLVVLATFLWPLLRPIRAVGTASIEAAEAAGPASTAMAEAAGWIEPDPFPTVVRPLVAGRVDRIPLLEGAEVQEGTTVVATLASAHLHALRARAEALLAEREREVTAAEERLTLADAQLEQRAQLRSALASAESNLLGREAQLVTARGMRERAVAEEQSAVAALAAQRALNATGGSYQVALQRAEAAATAAGASARAAAGGADIAEKELAAARTVLDVARDVAAKPVDLVGAVAIAKADLERARAQRNSAQTELDTAVRETEWLTVRAPASGVIMRVMATPGAFVGPEAEPLLSLYDPRRLRVRIDVPLASVGSIREGQEVEVRSEVLAGQVVKGRVQRIQRESDLLKNTLQVKVELVAPPPILRPETLCQARFLSDDAPAGEKTVTVFRVPRAAVQNGHVFVVNPTEQIARGIPVEVVRQEGEMALVRGELSVTQRAILVPVVEGERVREEEQ